MKILSRSTLLFVALTLTPPAAGMLVAGCGKTIAPQSKPGTDDLSITTRVKTAILNDPEIAGKIDVATANGVVTLSGTVKSPAERDKAVAVARKVSGVTDVKSSLQVQ
jgi:hyperosmotically inducible periplasmic protein